MDRTSGQVRSRRKIFEMKGSLALLVCLSFTLGGSQANPQVIKKESSSTLSRLELSWKDGSDHSLLEVGGEPDCQSDICVDCRASCDGCNKCPLCSLVQKACDAGKKLNFQWVSDDEHMITNQWLAGDRTSAGTAATAGAGRMSARGNVWRGRRNLPVSTVKTTVQTIE